MPANTFVDNSLKADSPAQSAAAVTPSNSTAITLPGSGLNCRALYVGGAGDVAVTTLAGDVVTFKNVVAGSTLPVMVTKVMATNTTATNIVALF